MITAAQRAGKLNRGIQPLALQQQAVTLLAQCRDFGLAHAGTRNNAGIKARLRQTDHTLRVMLNLLLVLIFLRQRLYLTGGARHIINRIYHRFVVVGDRKVALRFGDIEVGIQPAAVENRQRQPAGNAILLCGMAEQIAQM